MWFRFPVLLKGREPRNRSLNRGGSRTGSEPREPYARRHARCYRFVSCAAVRYGSMRKTFIFPSNAISVCYTAIGQGRRGTTKMHRAIQVTDSGIASLERVVFLEAGDWLQQHGDRPLFEEIDESVKNVVRGVSIAKVHDMLASNQSASICRAVVDFLHHGYDGLFAEEVRESGLDDHALMSHAREGLERHIQWSLRPTRLTPDQQQTVTDHWRAADAAHRTARVTRARRACARSIRERRMRPIRNRNRARRVQRATQRTAVGSSDGSSSDGPEPPSPAFGGAA